MFIQRGPPRHAVTPAGKKAVDKRLPDTEPKLRELFAKPQAKHGTVLVVVNQPASIGALPLAVARDMGCPVAYLPGLTMRRIADLYPGEAKTDAKDAFITADPARAMPHTLRAIDDEDETIAELEMIVGFDDDLAGEATRVANRLHGLLTQIHPSLERILGPRLQHPAVLTLLERLGSPAQIRKAGRRRLVKLLRPKAPRMAERLIEDIFEALDEQTVTVPGTEAAAFNSGSSIRGDQPKAGKQAAQTSLLPLRVRRPGRPGLPGLLRQKIAQGKHHTQALLCLLDSMPLRAIWTPMRLPHSAATDGHRADHVMAHRIPRRLNHRYERHPRNYLAFLGLAAAHCCYKRLVRLTT